MLREQRQDLQEDETVYFETGTEYLKSFGSENNEQYW